VTGKESIRVQSRFIVTTKFWPLGCHLVLLTQTFRVVVVS
jgi:hypothetical protein